MSDNTNTSDTRSQSVTRRAAIGTAIGAMGAAGMMGLMGSIGDSLGGFPVVKSALAKEASEASSSADAANTAAQTGADATASSLEDIQASEIEAAKAQNRRLDPIKFLTNKSNDELLAQLNDEAEVTEDYTTPNGKVIPAIYVRLRNRINRCAGGLGSIVTGDDHWDLFMDYYSEEDAQHILDMPLTGSFLAGEYAEKAGITEEEATEILDDLADRSLVWRMRRSGQSHYQIMGLIPGVWEWHELWEGVNGDQESMLAFNQDCDKAWGSDNPLASLYRPLVHVQACDNSIVDGDVPAYANWEAALDRFDKFGVMPCQCRTKQVNYGNLTEEECGRMDTCTAMGEIAEYFVSIGVARELTREEARANIQQNVDDGNTIEGYCNKAGGAYCSCNLKVCLFANAYKMVETMTGAEANSMPYLSDFNLAYDKDACIQCDACRQKCPMQAIEVDEDGYRVPTSFCFRCGQCATVCPVGARKLVPKEKWETFDRAADIFADNQIAAEQHMALGGIVDFTGDPSIFA